MCLPESGTESRKFSAKALRRLIGLRFAISNMRFRLTRILITGGFYPN